MGPRADGPCVDGILYQRLENSPHSSGNSKYIENITKHHQNMSLCSVFVSLLLYPLTPESPRWLIAVKREAEAERILQQIARINRSSSQSHTHSDVRPDKIENGPSLSLASLVSSKELAITTAILSLNWLVVDFCYYGLSLHSVHLGGDIFTNFALSALVEVSYGGNIAYYQVCFP